jgi:MFS family permease
MLATLRQRDFALLWSGDVISTVGDWVLIVGLPIYILILTHSVLATGGMMIAGRLPNILFGSLAGVFVDRWNRKRVMVVADALFALWLLPLLLVNSIDRVWIVYLVQFAESSIAQFFAPAENALLPNLVGKEQLVAANSLNALSDNLSRLVGPALGGIIIGLAGLSGVVLVDAASFVIAGLLFIFIRMSPAASQARAAKTPGSAWAAFWREWLDGLRLVRRERVLFVFFLVITITRLGEGVFGVLIIVFVNRVLHGGALQFGWLMSAQAIGALIGSVLVGWAGRRLLSPRWIGLCCIAFGLIDLAIFNSPAFFPAFLISFWLFVLVGVPGIAFATGLTALQQAATPDAYRGRVSSTFLTSGALMGLIGTIIAGALGDHMGVVLVLNIQGGVYILAGVFVLALLGGSLATRAALAAGEKIGKPSRIEEVAESPS